MTDGLTVAFYGVRRKLLNPFSLMFMVVYIIKKSCNLIKFADAVERSTTEGK